MSDQQPWWTDPRWSDPQTSASVHLPTGGAPPPLADDRAVPPDAPGPERRPPRVTPLLAALVGVAVGGAIGLPIGLSAHSSDPVGTTAAPALPAPQQSPTTDIPGKVDPSIVDITSRLDLQQATAAGTGMILTPDGEILTNNHVVVGGTSITVTSVTTGHRYPARVLGTDPSEDVALLKVDANALRPITPSRRTVHVGDTVVALGNAGGVGGTPAVANGFVTALGRTITASDSNGAHPQRLTGLIETDAPIRPGDSGGPLVDTRAQVIGMDTAASVNGTITGTTNRGFAIPIARALAIAHEIEQGHGSSTIHIGPRGMIGVQVSALSTGNGASVEAVTPGSPAQHVGIASGDTITGVNGHRVTTADSLGALVKAHAAGDQVTVSWRTAAGANRSARVTLAPGPPD